MSFFHELKRRNVFRVGIAYMIGAWLLLQIADVVLNNIAAPDWVFKTIMLLVGLGLPIALFFAWAFEMTPDGIKKEQDVDRSQSVTRVTGQKLSYTIIGLLAVALGYMAWDKARPGSEALSPPPSGQARHTGDNVTSTTTEPSIAVLPFVNMSNDPEQEYFSEGISEEILNVLVRVKGLKVASRTSSFTYKGKDLDIPAIAEELKVGNIVEGSVRKSGNRVRITAQLIDTSNDRHLWSDTFDRELTDIFAIQDEIAKAIVSALKQELNIGLEAVKVESTTDNLDAYELYLQARGLFLAREQLEESIRLYEQAVTMDPGFARAWSGLAAVYSVVESWGIYGRDWGALALDSAQKALEIDPRLSTPWAVMGQLDFDRGDYLSGFQKLDKAIELEPVNATHYLWRGIEWSELGYQKKALQNFEQCLVLDPAYENCRRHLAISSLLVGDEELALKYLQAGLDKGFISPGRFFIRFLARSGHRPAAALMLYNREVQASSFPGKAILDAAQFPEHDHSRGLNKFKAWFKTTDQKAQNYPIVFAIFETYDLVEPQPFSNRWVWLNDFSGFRQSAYFKPFVRKLRWPDYWRAKGFPPNCRPLGEDDFSCD